MDPNVCFQELISALMQNKPKIAQERAESLRFWIDRGGFKPDTFKILPDMVRDICYALEMHLVSND